MMTDRELLEAAAAARGLKNHGYSGGDMQEMRVHDVIHCGFHGPAWNSIKNSGDALELAVHLEISISYDDWQKTVDAVIFKSLGEENVEASEPYGDDKLAATRRAITRAAAMTVV